MAQAGEEAGIGWESFWHGGQGAPLEVMGPPAPPRAPIAGPAQSRARDLLSLRAAEAALGEIRGIADELFAQQRQWLLTGRITIGEGEERLELEGEEGALYARTLAGRLADRSRWIADAEAELGRVRAGFAARWGITLDS